MELKKFETIAIQMRPVVKENHSIVIAQVYYRAKSGYVSSSTQDILSVLASSFGVL